MNRLGGYISNYNAYSIPPASNDFKVDERTLLNEKQHPETNQQEKQKSGSEKEFDLSVAEIPVRENASIENVAITFGVYDASSLDIMGERGLASDDMRNAISGMRKDHILHEYQYFVGSSVNVEKENKIIADTGDGVVIKL
ncbi:hypothetical protein [Butyrivibrio sp. YAB3001]|uniref:hypothetical protein n=1 Tax=Butyrivibrio sp. YAB3001 TaxID=1520812 RepID=UPI0008F649A8|nr:hypothetical protein [Butyrivibrio sp. YAB3001]SFC81061.1 hypothetical protein SAMN02910398_03210 [Butyrivibrio sp. YAB3001]